MPRRLARFRKRRRVIRRKSVRRTYRRRPVKRRGFKRRRPRIQGAPNTNTLKLVYLDTTTPTLSVNMGFNIAYTRYKLNSAYDCDFGTFNKTTPGFYEWIPFYARYLVTWVRLTCTFVSRVDIPMYCGLFFRPITNDTSFNTWQDWRNMETGPYIKKKFLLSPQGGKTDRVTLSIAAPCWRIWGNKKEFYGEPNWGASMLENPLALVEGLVYLAMPTSTAASDSLNQVVINVRLTQYVKLYQRKVLKEHNYNTDGLGGHEDMASTTIVSANLGVGEDPFLGNDIT